MDYKENFDPYGLSPEIYCSPLPLIGMTGLDIKNKKSHVAVWEAFTLNRRSDRIPLKFVLLEKLEFPVMKQKRQSYEWYIPKGIIKSNWVNKYLNLIPSLLVLFWELDWSDPEWVEEKNKIASTIQSIKLALGGRNTRIAVVLLQSSTVSLPVPGDDGSGASDKAASLCAACDLPPKHLFVLPHSDSHLLGYTMRLENALSEISGGFYLGEIKGIKAHRDFLNKTNHHLLFIRHQFKIAFHNEMRGDPQTAIKHYGQCYHYLLEHRFTNTNLHEIRIVAAIVNYKICKLNFILNLPRDAIEQFKSHSEVFRQRTGPKELIFEHYAWLSKQYQVFGEVFEEAVREGLPAVQTQHPGFYYQQAANYAVLRRNTAMQVCKDAVPSESNLLEGWQNLEFYGQRPWRPEKHSLEPPEMQTEMEGIKAICYHELHKVDHSNLIIPQFSSAITQFKKYRCPRIKRSLMVLMSKEYHLSRQASKALTLLNHVMWDYRSERWWCLLSSCSMVALSCAYQMASIQEYISLSFEILGPRIDVTSEEKTSVYDNLIKTINGDVPDPPLKLTEEVRSMTSELWSFNIQSSRPSILVNMNDILPCLEVRAGFDSCSVLVDETAKATVKIKNHLYQSLQLYFLILYNDSSSHPQLKETDISKLFLEPNAVLDVTLHFQAFIQDIDKTVKITGVTLGFGTSPEKTVSLHWTGVGTDGVTVHTGSSPSLKEFGTFRPNPLLSDDLQPQLKVLSRNPKIEAVLKYDEIALVWEWLPVSITLTNNEISPLSDVLLSLGLEEGSDSNLEQTTQVSIPSNLNHKLASSVVSNHLIPNMAVGETTEYTLFVKSLKPGKRTLKLKVTYVCDVEVNNKLVVCPTVLTKTFTVASKIPFQITTETQSLQFSPLSRVSKRERFLIIPRIKCLSHVSIEFTNSSIGAGSHITFEGENLSQVSGTEVEEEEEATDCFCVSVGPDVDYGTAVSLGQYLLYWKRANEKSPAVSVSISLPSIKVEEWGIWVEADLPPQGTVRVPLTVAYEISNTSSHVQELSVSMQVSDAFMFAGHKEVRLRILPGWQECITYTLYPLLAGFVQLPRLHIDVESNNNPNQTLNSIDEFIQRILPSHMFIMPQEKPSPQMQEISSSVTVN